MRRLYEMAAHLLLAETPLSRNRNFAAFKDPRFARAIALYRRLRALSLDLEQALTDGTRVSIAEEQRGGRACVRLEMHGEQYRRTCFVETPAWEVLMMQPQTRAAVEALTRRAASRHGSDLSVAGAE